MLISVRWRRSQQIGFPLFEAFWVTMAFVTETQKNFSKKNWSHHQPSSSSSKGLSIFCNVASYAIWNFLKTRTKEKVFLKRACHTAVDADALWQRRPTKPILGRFSYYSLHFSLLAIMSIASLVETHALLQQTWDNLVVWNETDREGNPADQSMLDSMRLICQSIWMSLEGLSLGADVVDDPLLEEDGEEVYFKLLCVS